MAMQIAHILGARRESGMKLHAPSLNPCTSTAPTKPTVYPPSKTPVQNTYTPGFLSAIQFAGTKCVLHRRRHHKLHAAAFVLVFLENTLVLPRLLSPTTVFCVEVWQLSETAEDLLFQFGSFNVWLNLVGQLVRPFLMKKLIVCAMPWQMRGKHHGKCRSHTSQMP
jgi:hypothetical protein